MGRTVRKGERPRPGAEHGIPAGLLREAAEQEALVDGQEQRVGEGAEDRG